MELSEFLVRYTDETEPKIQVLCLNTPDDFVAEDYPLDHEVFYYLTVDETKRLLATPIGGRFILDDDMEVWL